MPYLRLYSPDLSTSEKRLIATELTDAVMQILPTQEREWITIHFMPFRPADFAAGGRLIEDGRVPDFLLELAMAGLLPNDKKKLVAGLTPLLMRLMHVERDDLHRINIKFADYDESDFAIGGQFLHELPKRRLRTAGKLAAIAATITAGLWLRRHARTGA